jgi:hypothetical protein
VQMYPLPGLRPPCTSEGEIRRAVEEATDEAQPQLAEPEDVEVQQALGLLTSARGRLSP